MSSSLSQRVHQFNPLHPLQRNLKGFWPVTEDGSKYTSDFGRFEMHGFASAGTPAHNVKAGAWRKVDLNGNKEWSLDNHINPGLNESNIKNELSISLKAAIETATDNNKFMGLGEALEDEVDNFLFHYQLRTSNEQRLLWEFGGGTNASVETTTMPTVTNEIYNHYGVTRKWENNQYVIRFYHKGLFVQELTDSNKASGGENARLILGDITGGSIEFSGELGEIRIYDRILDDNEMFLLGANDDTFPDMDRSIPLHGFSSAIAGGAPGDKHRRIIISNS